MKNYDNNEENYAHGQGWASVTVQPRNSHLIRNLSSLTTQSPSQLIVKWKKGKKKFLLKH